MVPFSKNRVEHRFIFWIDFGNESAALIGQRHNGPAPILGVCCPYYKPLLLEMPCHHGNGPIC